MVGPSSPFYGDGTCGGIRVDAHIHNRCDDTDRGRVVEIVNLLDVVDQGVRLALPVVVEAGGRKGL